MSNLTIIESGESLDFSFDRDGQSINDWACVISVKTHPDVAALLSRAVTPTGNVWSGFLTQTETAALDPGLYYLVADLTNTTTDEKEVIREKSRFRVTKAWT